MQNKTHLALIALRQIIKATEANARSLSRSAGLTPSQFAILRLLGRNGDTIPSVIAREMSLTQATVTALVDKLASRALVERRRDMADKRRVLVCLTPLGGEVLGTTPDSLQERFFVGLMKLQDWEQSSIISALERVRDIIATEVRDVVTTPMRETVSGMDVPPMLDMGLSDHSHLAPEE